MNLETAKSVAEHSLKEKRAVLFRKAKNGQWMVESLAWWRMLIGNQLQTKVDLRRGFYHAFEILKM